MKKLLMALLCTAALLAGCGSQTASDGQVAEISSLTKANRTDSSAIRAAAKSNSRTQATIASLQGRLNDYHHDASATKASESQLKAKATNQKAAHSTGLTNDNAALSAKTYAGQQEIVIVNDDPGFTTADKSTAAGGWERYGALDTLGRATAAEAMLNQSLMPTAKREALTVDPTGWHNRRTAHGWLYNRSHLIGFQLSGENNNPKNLITGTMSLNNPLMLAHEMDIAAYLKASPSRFVRYTVKPWYRGNELVARGVQMRAQSIGDNTIRFNVYIFNIEAGYTIDYATGIAQPN